MADGLFVSQGFRGVDPCDSQGGDGGGDQCYKRECCGDGDDGGCVVDGYSVEDAVHGSECYGAEEQAEGEA